MTDRVMEHGRSLAGLAPSTYEATLGTTVSIGYPTGSLMPLGIGHAAPLATTSRWLFQPYLTVPRGDARARAATRCWRRSSRCAPLRALAVFVAAQPAILFGYALWGGIKELAGALLLALLAVAPAVDASEPQAPHAPRAAAGAAVRCARLRSQPPGERSGSFPLRS